MYYVKVNVALPQTEVVVVEFCEGDPGDDKLYEDGKYNRSWQNRNDWNSFEEVTVIAAAVTKFTGKTFLPVDKGDSCSPRFDIVKAPAVGDEVSYGFNGDCYPDGTVVKVNANFRFVWTSTGKKYCRRHLTDAWKNNSWSLVRGHHYEQNPSF